MARNKDNQVGGFIKSAKPVRGHQEQPKKNTHNRRAGFDSKRNQAGYTLIELIQVLGFLVLSGMAAALLYFVIKGIIFLASLCN